MVFYIVKKRIKKKPSPLSYRHRTYRQAVDPAGLCSFEIKIKETDLHILASKDLSAEASNLVLQYRGQLEQYIADNPAFLTALTPLPFNPLAPPIVKAMLKAAQIADVGPMAAVAGAIAEFVGLDLLAAGAAEVVVENGGDIFMRRQQDSIVGVFAGTSPLSNKIGITIKKDHMPVGICTSSGTVGHSLSLGQADSATIVAPSATLADAFATRIGNAIKHEADINGTLALASTFEGIIGVVVICKGRLGVWGVEITAL